MKILKQSTTATVTVGPVLDANGAAVTTAVVGDFRISKNGTPATLSGATVTHDANGYYTIALTTSNTDTVGRLEIYSGNTAQATAVHNWLVLLASVFDALQTNATNSIGGLVTATGSVTALAGAISTLTAGGVRTELTTELNRIDATISSRLATTSYTAPPTAGVIADAVWDEAYSGHTTAGTFGKLMDTLRKSNTVLEGTILASPTPTTTVFRISGADYPTGALTGSVLWMNSGASQEQNSPILSTTNNGDGTITVTLENALVTAPSAGDTVLIDPTSHVHSVAEIQSGLATAANLLIAIDRVSYCLSALAGNCSTAQTATETYVLSIGGNTYTAAYSGLDGSGNRSTTTLTKA
jgi:hypothetical protein